MKFSITLFTASALMLPSMALAANTVWNGGVGAGSKIVTWQSGGTDNLIAYADHGQNNSFYVSQVTDPGQSSNVRSYIQSWGEYNTIHSYLTGRIGVAGATAVGYRNTIYQENWRGSSAPAFSTGVTGNDNYTVTRSTNNGLYGGGQSSVTATVQGNNNFMDVMAYNSPQSIDQQSIYATQAGSGNSMTAKVGMTERSGYGPSYLSGVELYQGGTNNWMNVDVKNPGLPSYPTPTAIKIHQLSSGNAVNVIANSLHAASIVQQ